MTLTKAYYVCKPLLPWRLRIALRRTRAVYKRKACAGHWPIDQKASAAPLGWTGWPQGKRFAVVLTHDVEGRRGFDRVAQLMHLEAELGFQSCFNFVPEGEYRVPDVLRFALEASGFEVGIHGLKHDGKLYRSHTEFSRRAARIREYGRQWKAVGFRSPFMQHNLEWIQELGMEYDASTFDTDPFEPQSDGAGTIFPFWVSNHEGGGYVELPYTLVQDFTLFVILKKRTNEIWKQKLDWVAERGGMVLMNTHPDYMCFEGKSGREEYAVNLYGELLSYIRRKYEGAYWHALPREVASFYRVAAGHPHTDGVTRIAGIPIPLMPARAMVAEPCHRTDLSPGTA
jgi:peptidoglycan/xylan/chitin deacetylase (PgdA/CDA1 family)